MLIRVIEDDLYWINKYFIIIVWMKEGKSRYRDYLGEG